MASEADYQRLKDTLHNTSGDVPLANRFRALFSLKGLANDRAIDIIGAGESNPKLDRLVLILYDAALPKSSALLGHELAYCLGQIGSTHALPVLEAVLRDENYHPMVRHESAEAMGAISSIDSLPVLREFRDKEGECQAVVETCEIAVAKVEWDHKQASSEKTARRYVQVSCCGARD